MMFALGPGDALSAVQEGSIGVGIMFLGAWICIAGARRRSRPLWYFGFVVALVGVTVFAYQLIVQHKIPNQ